MENGNFHFNRFSYLFLAKISEYLQSTYKPTPTYQKTPYTKASFQLIFKGYQLFIEKAFGISVSHFRRQILIRHIIFRYFSPPIINKICLLMNNQAILAGHSACQASNTLLRVFPRIFMYINYFHYCHKCPFILPCRLIYCTLPLP